MAQRLPLLMFTMILIVSLTACGGTQVSQQPAPPPAAENSGGGAAAPAVPEPASAPSSVDEYTSDASEAEVGGAPPVVAEREGPMAVAPTATVSAGASGLPAPATDGMIAEAPAAAPESGAPMPRPDPRQAPEAAIKAGEINDNEQFAAYLDYLQGYSWGNVRHADVSERYVLRVLGEGQRPLHDARVTVYDGERQIFQGRTYADGRALFMPRISDTQQTTEFRVVAAYGAVQGEALLRRGEVEVVEIGLRGATPEEALRLDLLFMLDTTGSMEDELRRIQQTIDSIAERIDAFTPRPAIHYGLVAYKDVDDEYVTRSFDFTPDLAAFRLELARLSANGGGDTPEAVDEALYDGMMVLQWRDEPTVRIAFLVADAGPHVPGPSQFTYLDGIREAVARGVKIYPVAASNTEPQAEYVFRQLAQQTMASFIFLTYQPGASSGAPGESTPLEAGEQAYTVERLDDLIVGIVERELRAAVGAR
ncbi:MAG: VWA domain-containing protein [Candidatus Viridilinea halotolerans]|uniref:VWA domain-containing protein n=1 Tax=Candidatus Viridilinea halotolerans TaxID=2491704 RepID=A0A426TXH4_9CHLR|nr:MAG: VWA domain-containing protein [Candidatus Viridilinea halotolerans]